MEQIGILCKNTKKKKECFPGKGLSGTLGRCLEGSRNSTKTSVARVSEGLGGAVGIQKSHRARLPEALQQQSPTFWQRGPLSWKTVFPWSGWGLGFKR